MDVRISINGKPAVAVQMPEVPRIGDHISAGGGPRFRVVGVLWAKQENQWVAAIAAHSEEPKAFWGEGEIAADPRIVSIDPSEVPQGWSGTLVVEGTNFNVDSWVLIDGRFPHTEYKSPTRLEVSVPSAVTDTPGKKEVKVHQLDTGSLSNTVLLTVRQ